MMSFLESTDIHQHSHTLLDDNTNLKDKTKYPWNSDFTLAEVHTPSKSKSIINDKVIEGNSCDQNASMINNELSLSDKMNSQDGQRNIESRQGEQFDSIITNVNDTIKELNNIYRQIGYSSTEVSIKKSEIFTVIEDTIANFTSNLKREQNNIEYECEWLRQQIRIILAMVNDNNGEKSLGLMDRGILFIDKSLYEEGYKENILRNVSNIQNRNESFYASSPFNIESTEIPAKENSSLNQYELMLKNIPQLSLLQLKSKLNSIFLEVLKTFARSFKKLNELTIGYFEIIEVIGEVYSTQSNVNLLKSLPTKEEAESHKELLEQFEIITKQLNLSYSSSKLDPLVSLNGKSHDQYAFVVSSPRKATTSSHCVNLDSSPQISKAGLVNHLQEINYKIVQVIRGLKLTKITPEILSNIQREIEFCDSEFFDRKQKMSDGITRCFHLINILQLNDEQLFQIQNQFEIGISKNNEVSGDQYFDFETLKFIQVNPKHFGLNDNQLGFISRFVNILQRMKDKKQAKREFYIKACKSLWEKLGESQEYIDNFMQVNNSLTDISLMNFKGELKRLYLKRSECIESFIIDSRVEIEKLWDKMFYSNEQRTKFKYYNFDVRDGSMDKEIVLNEHELELENLKLEYEAKEPIISLYNQLNELAQDQMFLKESSKDSSRLLSKNSCKILLNEEKIRKKINRNMPRLIENLKKEVIKFNDLQHAEGHSYMSINGEDFFEKLLLIESEQLSQNNNRNGRNKVNNTKQDSPVKSRRSSPVKSTSKSPSLFSEKPMTSNKNSFKSSKRSPSSISPAKNHTMKRPPCYSKQNRSGKSKPLGTSIANKLTTALNLSLSTDSSTSTFGSPLSISQTSIPAARTVVNQLQPLNSPLVADNYGNPEFCYQLNENSNLSKISPLRENCNVGNNFSSLYNSKSSPVVDFRSKDDKENSVFQLSPIKLDCFKISDFDKEPSVINSGVNSNYCDSSTLIGEDYQIWRNEKIKQINKN